MFQVRGRCAFLWPLIMPALACFVCCIIWLIKSSCWRVKPSFPAPAGDELGDEAFDVIAVIVLSAFVWYWIHVAPCGELASPASAKREVFLFVSRLIFYFEEERRMNQYRVIICQKHWGNGEWKWWKNRSSKKARAKYLNWVHCSLPLPTISMP